MIYRIKINNTIQCLLQQYVIKWHALCAKYHDHQINVVEMCGTFVINEKE